jgi:hypothetical protein
MNDLLQKEKDCIQSALKFDEKYKFFIQYCTTKNFNFLKQHKQIHKQNLYEYLVKIKPLWHRAMLTEVEYLSLYIPYTEYLSIYSTIDIPNELKTYSSTTQQYPNLNIGNVAKDNLNCILFYRYINELLKN